MAQVLTIVGIFCAAVVIVGGLGILAAFRLMEVGDE